MIDLLEKQTTYSYSVVNNISVIIILAVYPLVITFIAPEGRVRYDTQVFNVKS